MFNNKLLISTLFVSAALSASYPIQRQAAMLQFFAGAHHGHQATHRTPTILANSMHMENSFCDINTYSCNVHIGLLLIFWMVGFHLPFWRIDAEMIG